MLTQFAFALAITVCHGGEDNVTQCPTFIHSEIFTSEEACVAAGRETISAAQIVSLDSEHRPRFIIRCAKSASPIERVA